MTRSKREGVEINPVVLALIVSVVVTLIGYPWVCSNVKAVEKTGACTAYISFIGGDTKTDVSISEDDKACIEASDCVLIQTDCGGCSCGETMNKKFRPKYRSIWDEVCRDYMGEMCEMDCLEPILRCVDGSCKDMTSLHGAICESDDDCSLLDCSHFDNQVKTAFKPECVENICKCMCRGCE